MLTEPHLIRGSSRSGGAPSQFTSTMISQLLEQGILQSHIRHILQPTYAKLYHLTMAAIREHLLPLGVTLPSKIEEVAGGYFIWIELPEPLCADDIVPLALCQGVKVASGELFKVQGDPAPGRSRFENNIRICFAWEEEDGLVEGVRRLAEVIVQAL